jgi:hypothetical protein
MLQITHRDLVAFADEKVNLKKSEVDDQRAQVNRLRNRIEAKIDAAPEYGLVKSLHAGSVAKGTALRNVNDRDLAVYVKAGQAPDDTPSLVHWLRDQIGEAYSMLSADQIVANTNRSLLGLRSHATVPRKPFRHSHMQGLPAATEARLLPLRPDTPGQRRMADRPSLLNVL